MKNHKLTLTAFAVVCWIPTAAFATDLVDELTELSLEQLLDLEVTSVARKPQKVSESAAAIFVITGEDIRRSGVTSIPEALRMAPGVQVSRIDAHKWAIAIRGFNSRFTNKLLVLIDGRTVYTPSYSGVYWDVQDTMLSDIERIEVIRSPGATMWGANAMNGIINIITKQAVDTQGGLVNLGAGNEEKGLASFRYGTDIGTTGNGRLYAKYHKQDSYRTLATEEDAGDSYRSLQCGFRFDWDESSSDKLTLQGDLYRSDGKQLLKQIWLPTAPFVKYSVKDSYQANGANLLTRWQHRLENDSLATLQVYYDHNDRNELYLGQNHETIDVDFQHSFAASDRHEIVWGLGYRRIQADYDSTFQVSISPESQSSNLYSAFLQDDVTLVPDLFRLTLGAKFEHNEYSGIELQPNIQLLWTPHPRHNVWASVSRAVRTPSKIESNGKMVTFVVPSSERPMVGTVNGSENFDSEELVAYELGYRLKPVDSLSFDLALYYNDYEDLQSFEQISALSVGLANKLHGEIYGAELSMDWQVTEWWRLQSAYSYGKTFLHAEPGSTLGWSEQIGEGSMPEHMFSIRSSMELGDKWQLNLSGSYVDSVPTASVTALAQNLSVDSYTSVNINLTWQPRPGVEVALIGHNIQDSGHLEFVGEGYVIPTEVERSIYGRISLTF